ncbi:MAG: S8/S53 family peptidase [Pseudomonadota bacterium]
MRRLRQLTVALGVTAGTLFVLGCPKPPVDNGPAPDAHGPPTPAPDPKPRTVKFDPFATAFAVVEIQPGDNACTLPAGQANKWTAVQGPRQAEKLPDIKGDAKTQRAQSADASGKVSRPGAVAAETPAPEANLSGFCVYRWLNEKEFPRAEDFDAIKAIPDSPIVGGVDHGPREIPKLPETVWEPLLKTFDHMARGIDRKDWPEFARKYIDTPAKAVRVAVIDATPKGVLAPDRSLHGFAVSRVIGNLLCSDPGSAACAKRVLPYLALPMISKRKEDLANGGYFGSFFQLYDALSRALADWDSTKEHLVINLSLGWDPIKALLYPRPYVATQNPPLNPMVGRIRALLENASCRGALIVGAAGNPTGTEGPIFPAGFEELPAPDAKTCAKRGLASPSSGATARREYAPLIHAVGAVDNADQRLMVNRRWGQPRLSALGLNVMVPGAATPYTAPFTGTSVSAAIVSGIAAAIWSVKPQLDAAGVIALLYQGGVELDGGRKSNRARTEFCLHEGMGPCRDPQSFVRRAYLCGPLAKLLPQAKRTCDPSIAPDQPKWPAVQTPNSDPPLQSCRVPGCGLPSWPTRTHLVADVEPHGGVTNCPACTFNISLLGLGTVHGTPVGPVTPVSPRLRLDTSGYFFPDFFEFGSSPPFGQPMNMTSVMVPMLTYGATLTWFFFDGIAGWDPDEPAFLQVIRE